MATHLITIQPKRRKTNDTNHRHKTPNTITLLCFGLLMAHFSTATAEKIKPPAPVNLSKCCPLSQHLDQSQNCVVGGSDKWVPQILMLSRKKFYSPTGEAPRFFRIQEGVRPANCSTDLQLYAGNQLVVSSDGSLYVQEIAKSFRPLEFCVDKDVALVCKPPPPSAATDEPSNMINQAGLAVPSVTQTPAPMTRLRKCCGPNAVYDLKERNCFGLSEGSVHTDRKVSNASRVEVIYGFPQCSADALYTMVGSFRDANFDENTGTLRLPSGRTFNTTQFCVEHTVDDDVFADTHSFTCADLFEQQDSIPVATSDEKDVQYMVLAIGLFISVVFLSATLATAFILPSSHHVLHWRCQTYYVACLLVGDLLLAITQISGNAIAGPACATIASTMHFFFLAAFFWLNTMCVNIWWTFRDFRPTSLEKSQELLRLRLYQVYAWGVPLIIAGVAAILDNLPATNDSTYLRPRFGVKGCWFYGDIEIFTYFFGPIGLLLVINFLLFASTARQLTCGLWKRDDVKSTTERSALGRVCLKLVVVMGVTWVADVLSWAVGGPRYFWYVTDLINALQGVLIFIVVGCQPQVWTACKRLWSLKTGRDTMNTTNGAQNSSSSHGLPSIGESVTNQTNTTTSKMPMETIC